MNENKKTASLPIALGLFVSPLVVGGIRYYQHQRRLLKHKLKTHRQRSRAVAGCVECGVAVSPGPDAIVWVCGGCTDTYSLCAACYSSPAKHLARDHLEARSPAHRFHPEQVNWEVDVERLKVLARQDSLQRALHCACLLYTSPSPRD